MHRPAFIPAPKFAVKLIVGEMADAALASQRALPGQPLAHGYHFRYPEIDIAFRGIFGD
jgi:NAD dependent epimerase/dehydratase family enzyme